MRQKGESPAPKPLTVARLLLLDPHGSDLTHVDSLVVNDLGIGVIRRRGDVPRLLPWGSVVAHAVEPWGGGVIPEWWTDAVGGHLDQSMPESAVAPPESDDLLTARRHLPHAEAGALISIRTRTGTYRFLREGADPFDQAARIGAFAVRQQGPSGLSTVTTVAPARLRRGYSGRSGWVRVRPILGVFLVVIVITTVVLILLQSAGVIHLPFLGGTPTSATR